MAGGTIEQIGPRPARFARRDGPIGVPPRIVLADNCVMCDGAAQAGNDAWHRTFGYPRSMAEHVLEIDDMSCSHCVNAVTKALASVPGVKVLGVALGSARIDAEPAAVPHAVSALDRVGFPARAHRGFTPTPPQPRTPER